MRLLKLIYEKTHNKSAPYYYNYLFGEIICKAVQLRRKHYE